MFESDSYFTSNWLAISLQAAATAKDDGISVGAVTSVCIQEYLLALGPKYGITEVLPASSACFGRKLGHMFLRPQSPTNSTHDYCLIFGLSHAFTLLHFLGGIGSLLRQFFTGAVSPP